MPKVWYWDKGYARWQETSKVEWAKENNFIILNGKKEDGVKCKVWNRDEEPREETIYNVLVTGKLKAVSGKAYKYAIPISNHRGG
jgi:hypothetical protein